MFLEFPHVTLYFDYRRKSTVAACPQERQDKNIGPSEALETEETHEKHQKTIKIQQNPENRGGTLLYVPCS